MDDPIIWYEGAGVNASARRHLFADHQGSIIAMADGNGAPVGINRYDDWGVPDASNVGRFQYTGQAWLPDLGMYHYKARIYSPTLGRFLQTDPIGYQDQFNLYAYVGNDPVNARDPSGEAAVEPEGVNNDIIVRAWRCEACRSASSILHSNPGLIFGNGPQFSDSEANNDIVVLGRRVAEVAWCVATTLDPEVAGVSPGDVSDALVIFSQPTITKESVTGRRGVMRGRNGQPNRSGPMTSPLSALARSVFGRNVGRRIARTGSRVLLPLAAALEAYRLYNAVNNLQNCYE